LINENEVKLTRILKHVITMDDNNYKRFRANREREYERGKISYSWFKAFIEICDSLRGFKE